MTPDLTALTGELQLVRGDRSRPDYFHRFEAAVDSIATIDDPETIGVLLDFLEDDLDDDLAFGIIHAVERFQLETYVPRLLEEMPGLLKQSERWAETLMIRVVNSATALPVLLDAARSLDEREASAARTALALAARLRPAAADVCDLVTRALPNLR